MVNDGGFEMPEPYKGPIDAILDGEAMGFMQKEMSDVLGLHRARISAWKAADRAPEPIMEELRRFLNAVANSEQTPPLDTTAFEKWKREKEHMGNKINKLLAKAKAAGLTAEQVAKAGAILPTTLEFWRKNSRRISRDAFRRMESYVAEAARDRHVPTHVPVEPEAKSNGANGTSARLKGDQLVQSLDLSGVEPAPKNHSPRPATPLITPEEMEMLDQKINEALSTSDEDAKVAKPAPVANVKLWQTRIGDVCITAPSLAEAATNAIELSVTGELDASTAAQKLEELECAPLGGDVTIVTFQPATDLLHVKTRWIIEEK